MSTFTVRGILDGLPAEVTWSDEIEERLAGDTRAIVRVEELEDSEEPVAATPTGPEFVAGRDPAEVALVTMLAVFDDVAEVSGDVPEIPGTEIPAGARA